MSSFNIVCGKYRLVRRIMKCDQFVDVYAATDLETEKEVVLKREALNATSPKLSHEHEVYKNVYEFDKGIPCIYWFGSDIIYNVLAMESLGPSLQDLFFACKKKFSLKTVLMLTDVLLTRLEYLHSKDYIHKCVKPANFLVGKGEKRNKIYMIDFGASQKYRYNGKIHKPWKRGLEEKGNPGFCSTKFHLGDEQSRRDDLESLAYTLIYFLKGSLPWQELGGYTKAIKYDRLTKKKLSTPIYELCEGLPSEFSTLLDYSLKLDFDEDPDYEHLRQLFRNLFHSKGFEYDDKYDWSSVNFGAVAVVAVDNCVYLPKTGIVSYQTKPVTSQPAPQKIVSQPAKKPTPVYTQPRRQPVATNPRPVNVPVVVVEQRTLLEQSRSPNHNKKTSNRSTEDDCGCSCWNFCCCCCDSD